MSEKLDKMSDKITVRNAKTARENSKNADFDSDSEKSSFAQKIEISHEKSAEKTRKSDENSASKLVGRDSIYIDTDDDITSIIEKVKSSRAPVVALVPPARIGVLQSVVNLKLLLLAAKNSRKKLVLISNEKSLITLAAGLKIPVAKSVNAQAEIPASDFDAADLTDQDVIRGDEISVGELAKLAGSDEPISQKSAKKSDEISVAVKSIETDDKIKNDADGDGEPDDAPSEENPREKRKIRGTKIPNFDGFRKKVLIFGGLGVILIAFLVWALIFAPHGTITVKAETATKEISAPITLSSDATDVNSGKISAIVKQTKTNETLNFSATGKKMIGGAKATGTITLTNHSATKFDPNTGETNAINLAAGTIVSINNQQFLTDAAVSVAGGGGTNSVAVTAVNFGVAYNIAANSPVRVSGYDQATELDGAAKGAFSGGENQTENTVVQQSDIDTATEKLKNQIESGKEKVKTDLTAQMGNSTTVIAESFSVNYASFNSSPALDSAPAAGSGAVLRVEVTYTLIGAANSDLQNLLNSQLNLQIGDDKNQKIYDNGFKTLKIANFQPSGAGFSANVVASGKIGPKLDENEIKQMSIGKRAGEIRESLTKISGVKDVEIDFSPFFVNEISDEKKLTVNFAVE